MANCIDAGDGFLTQIAALRKADRLRVAANLLRKVIVGDIEAKERKARFDSSRFDACGVAANRSRGNQRSSDRCGVASCGPNKKRLRFGIFHAADGHGATGNGRRRMIEEAQWRIDALRNKQIGCFLAGYKNLTQFTRSIDELNILGDDVPVKVRDERLRLDG